MRLQDLITIRHNSNIETVLLSCYVSIVIEDHCTGQADLCQLSFQFANQRECFGNILLEFSCRHLVQRLAVVAATGWICNGV